jgi:hypothetical protein
MHVHDMMALEYVINPYVHASSACLTDVIDD